MQINHGYAAAANETEILSACFLESRRRTTHIPAETPTSVPILPHLNLCLDFLQLNLQVVHLQQLVLEALNLLQVVLALLAEALELGVVDNLRYSVHIHAALLGAPRLLVLGKLQLKSGLRRRDR